jgi:hypothetical protein
MSEAEIVKWVLAGLEGLVELGVKLGARRDAVLDGIDAGLKLARLKNDEDLAKKHPGHTP